MSDVVTLVNTTQRPIRTRSQEGTAVVFAPAGHPGSSVNLTKTAADYIRGNLLDQVSVLTAPRGESYMEREVQQSFWIANMTGDPDAPAMFTETFQEGVEGKSRQVEIRNEMREPRTYKTRMGRFHGIKEPGTFWCRQSDRTMGWNVTAMQVTLPGKIVVIPPYSRIEVNQSQFETLLMLDREQPQHKRGQLIGSRAPSDFEPNLEDPFWTLDNLRTWIEAVPGTDDKEPGAMVMGPSEAELRAEYPDVSPTDWSLLLHDARLTVWKRCKLRCLDPQFNIPTKDEFNLAKARKSKASKNDKA